MGGSSMSQIMDKLGIPLDKWERHQDTYTSIVWKSDPQCTESEWNTAVKHVQDEYDAQAYARTRKTLYPDIGDQLDDLYKQGAFSADMAAKIKKVKDDNPKE